MKATKLIFILLFIFSCSSDTPSSSSKKETVEKQDSCLDLNLDCIEPEVDGPSVDELIAQAALEKFLNPEIKQDCNGEDKVFNWTANDGDGSCSDAIIDPTLCDPTQAALAFGNVVDGNGKTPNQAIQDFQADGYSIDENGCGRFENGSDGVILILTKSSVDNGTLSLSSERLCTGTDEECTGI